MLGQFPSGATFHFHFYPTDGAMVDLDCGRPYTAIRLIHGFFGMGRVENGSYLVPVSPDTQRQLWVRLQFPKGLPSLETWPTKDSLEIGD